MSGVYQQTGTSNGGFDDFATIASPSLPRKTASESYASKRSSEEDILHTARTTNFGAISEDRTALSSDKFTSPDQLLTFYGAKNLYLLFVWLAMAVVWGLSAMAMMVSAFLMSQSPYDKNGTLEDGTIAKDFDLVNDQAHLANYTASAFLIGVTIGSLFLPSLSDKLGRRPIVILSMFFLGFFGIAAAFTPEIYSFFVIRFLQGCFFTGCGITNWVLAYESIPLRLRSYTAMTFGLFWVTGYCAVGPLAYFLQDWRWLLATVSAPSLIASVIYYFTVPESFHYVVSRGKSPELERWIERVNCFADYTNGPKTRVSTKEIVHSLQRTTIVCQPSGTLAADVEVADEVLVRIEEPSQGKNLVQQLVTNRTLLIYTLVMTYLWTCDTFVYYGLSLFSTQLAGNPYVNFTLVGLVEIPSYVVSPFFLNWLGRKRFVSACHCLAAVSFFSVMLFENPFVLLFMWLLGKFAISCAFTSLFVYASELFPTIVRTGCIGICSVVARFGGTLAPMVQNMAIISPNMPTFFFGVCATIGSALIILLPETADRELPDSPNEMS